MNDSFQLCGRWPFSLPHFFALTICCNSHDHAYLIVRAQALEYIITNMPNATAEDIFRLLNSEPYRVEIHTADDFFYMCMRNYLAEISFAKRLILTPVAKRFERLVRTVGFEVWKIGTLLAWSDLQTKKMLESSGV